MQNKLSKIISLALIIITIFQCSLAAAEGSVGITTYSNGALTDNTFNNGVFTALTSGTGTFAVAQYKSDELAGITVVQSDEALDRLNVVLENSDGITVKVFRFDENNNPLCVNSELSAKLSDRRIYVNDTFDEEDHSIYYTAASTTRYIEDGRLCLTQYYEPIADSTGKIEHTASYGTSVRNHGKKFIYELDVEVDDPMQFRLISTYINGSIFTFARLMPSSSAALGFKIRTADSNEYITDGKSFNIAVVIDFENESYDMYLDKRIVAQGISMPVTESSPYTADRTVTTRYTSNFDEGKIYIDNVRAYEGSVFLDLGNELANVSHTDYSTESGNTSDVFSRPSSEKIAKAVLSAEHPRLLISRDRVAEIETSSDANVQAMLSDVMSAADSAVTNGTLYKRWLQLSSTGSMYDINETMELIMNLGLAYMLTGNTKYSDHAYKQAELICARPDWNSASYLDVGEVSFILALCYDWMYDAWTPAQKEYLSEQTFSKGIDLSYRVYYGLNSKLVREDGNTYEAQTGWWDNVNNWNAVCNGGVLLASIAFMEYDAYRCSQLTQAALGGLEYLFEGFAPNGAWEEGPSYWQYTLKYVTAAAATLSNVLGNDTGIKDAEGFDNTHLYALSLEGKTGVVNLGDVNGNHVHSPQLFYWARVYNKPELGGAALYITDKFGQSANVFDLIYYDPDYVDKNYQPPLSTYTAGTEVVTFASGYDDDDTFVAVNGGTTSTNHSHIDSGSIVLDMKGERFVYDLGADSYSKSGYFDSKPTGKRFLYYRTRPEGHNTFVINPGNVYDTDGTTQYYGQYKNALSEITSHDLDAQTAVMNLSAAYARDASSATRSLGLDGATVTIEDAIVLSDGSVDNEIHWYFHTNADISIDGNIATLTKNGKSVTFKFELTAADGTASALEKVESVRNVASTVTDSTNTNCPYKLRFKINGASGTVKLKITIQ